MRRYHSQGDLKTRGRRRKAYHVFRGNYPRPFDIGEGRKNNWNKRHPLDCGKTDCLVCHGDKLIGTPDRSEERADVSLREQVRELEA